MANQVDGGFLREAPSSGTLGALVVTGTVAATGGLTDTQLRATAVPVSGPVTDTQLRATAVPVSGPVTDTQLRATAVPVSGPVTDTQLRAAAVPVAASPETGSVYNGTTALVPKFKLLNIAASSTNSTLVAAVTSKKIRVLAAVFVAGATATDLTFNSAAAGAISCKFANAANGGATLPFNPAGWFETVAGEALAVTTGTGATTGIQITYVEV